MRSGPAPCRALNGLVLGPSPVKYLSGPHRSNTASGGKAGLFVVIAGTRYCEATPQMMKPTQKSQPQKAPLPKGMEPLTVAAAFLEKSFGAQFLLALIVILLLKWPTLDQPPMWDTAMGLFPAAITLAGNGFDMVELLGMPGFRQGGPNTHSASSVTLMTAVVLKFVGSSESRFIILHLLHFAVAALSLVTLFRLARPAFGPATTLLFCGSVLLYPVFSAQVGFLYLEIPLFLCAVSALLAWTHQRFWLAIFWSTLAVATKESGLIVPATLVLATLLERRALSSRLKRAGLILAFPLVLAGMLLRPSLIAVLEGSDESNIMPPYTDVLPRMVEYLRTFLFNVPDLLLFLVLFLVAAIAYGKPVFRSLRSEPSDLDSRDPTQQEQLLLGYTGILIVFFLLLFFVALPTALRLTIVLPRYYLVILPFLLIWLGYGFKRLLSTRLTSPAAVCFFTLSVFFATNANGAFYPLDINTEGAPGNNFSLTERSNAYRRLLALEVEAIRFVEELPDESPIYYGLYEHYLFSYPQLGYVTRPLANGQRLSPESLEALLQTEPFPACVYALYNYPWLGGEHVRDLLLYASRTEALSSEIVREFRDGRYTMVVIRFRNGDQTCPER